MRSLALRSIATAIVWLGTLAPGGAADRWEAMQDGNAFSENVLRHGLPQFAHDLEGAAANPDQDWMLVATKEQHSYEARVSGLYWEIACGGAPCPRFDRVDSTGAILTAGGSSNDDVFEGDFSKGFTVRWIGQPGGPKEYLRALGDQFVDLPASRTYDVEFFDTTVFVPRWNNSATQVTVFAIQNTTNATVSGFIYFYDGAGTLVFSVALNVVQHGAQVLNTSTIPALVGKSGTALIAQLGGYGAITGKAVALEPGTGFTFDTAMTSLPR